MRECGSPRDFLGTAFKGILEFSPKIMRIEKRYLGRYLLLATAAAALGGTMKAQDEGINWLGNYREALRQAKETRKPVLVEFRCEA